MKRNNLNSNSSKHQGSRPYSNTLKGVLSFVFCFASFFAFAQVTSSIDTTKIKIGEQITYKIQVEADTTDIVVFPEGQTFMPLEMIESYKVDTTKNKAKFKLIKTYGLTQFDSGSYSIPKQKIVVGNQTFYTDSLSVEVHTVAVDTTKQKLYDIKPMIAVEKASSNWWKYVLYILLPLLIAAFVLYWFIWRKKPLTEEEEIALLPPYHRAKLALQKLDERDYLQKSELKDYYSELTFIIRKYLDEKVYDRALESTTDELIDRLNLLRDANKIELSKEDISNIETILKRADLVKFAKSAPDIELAKLDRNTIDVEIDQVREALPEPSEEEKLLDRQYKEEQERKKKKEKILLTVCASILILIATYVGFGLKYGFGYVTDTIVGNETKELLEGDWVRSDYGIPPIMISTPEVLERTEVQAIDSTQTVNRTAFSYGTIDSDFNIAVGTTRYQLKEGEDIDVKAAIEETIKLLENNGARNLLVKEEQFITPNAAEGFKVYGTGEFPANNAKDDYRTGEYVILVFVSTDKSVLQKIALIWNNENDYANQIMDRVIASVELKKIEE
ncbi:BatD family protein [Psychroserpens sp. SPM9]|uniref:BatD family protein n=1 Tax=Psychroserpens sp. SPM9 TaxID=2975598 RepID=UPI0021A65E38|nr:BatD family protein [Psychroserpens sp. SPM9]MDG5490888.1 BatD family protein [Psychroserpens sp. SPM9]